MLSKTIGFVGAGQMAKALASGMVASQLVPAKGVIAYDPTPAAAESFADQIPGAVIESDNAAVAKRAEVIVLAVKPQVVQTVLAQLGPEVEQRHLVISIAAGVTIATIQAGLPQARVVRVMPNTPCLVGFGASAYALGNSATPADSDTVRQLLESVGIALQVDEKLLDAVTGLSGSGPAYVFTMIEALSDGGVRAGLPRSVATALAVQTVRGAAEMVATSHEHPAVLKERVTSPGGTSIAGLQAAEEHGLRAALIAAVQAATNRSIELGG